ncbi:hypothetical protein EV641_109218 [Rhodococcus sp. SMB37]|uniref:hypothetical protein n=1 Tax=Rhodococcus sp. SMB37 TaxID=2512213 RepID=UPI0010451C87|nr:hypothetical protein [Rhodococcus sp. SMB37]TCN51827.1 hypothetical protein EV641_109218 [Rhodococcus sp. SMB37]
MNARDELARTLAICDDYDGCFERVDEWETTPAEDRSDDEYPASDYEDCQWWLRRADAVLAAGWRKVGADTDTHTEWAIHDHVDGVTSPIGHPAGAEERARQFAKHRPNVSVRSREVTTGPWREVEQ